MSFLKNANLRPIVFWMPIAVFALMVVLSLANPDRFIKVATRNNDWILANFSTAFSYGTFLFVLSCIWAFFSPLGKIKIGGKDAEPLLSRWNWLAITLTTTIAIGILFWATAEPIYHLYTPGGLAVEAGGPKAAQFSMVSLFMNWSITPYAIYTVPALTFALTYHNLKKPFSLSSPVSVLTGRPMPKAGGDVLDGLALLAMLFGLSASLGAGILSISGGIDRLTPLSTSSVLQGCVAFAIITAFFVSSASGLHRGIRFLSDINTKVFFGLLLFVLIAGPTGEILSFGLRSMVQYAGEFIPRSLTLSPFNDTEWNNAWTVFYWANWLAWAPLTAMFLGRISRGYTVRAFICVNFLLPALFSIFWMTVFGGMALNIETNTPGLLNDVLQASGPEHILYLVVDQLPLAIPVATLLVIVSFLSYVTAADSSTDVLANLSLKPQKEPATTRQKIWIKLVWAVTVGFAAWIMTSLSGIDGIKMLSNLGGLPALFIVLLFNAALIVLGTVKRKDL